MPLFFIRASASLLACLCYCSFLSVTAQAQENPTITWGRSGTTSTVTAERPMNVVNNSSVTISLRVPGQSNVQLGAGGTYQLGTSITYPNQPVSVAGEEFDGSFPPYVFEFFYTGSAVLHSGTFEAVTFTGIVKDAEPYTSQFMPLPVASATIEDGGAITINDPNETGPSNREELMLLLENKTTGDQTVMWGDKPLVLKPGMNQLRYDGPVDSGGFPTVAPDDFQGTRFGGGGGGGGVGGTGSTISTPYVFGVIDYHSTDEGVEWQSTPPYVDIPNGDTPPVSGEWIEVISPETDSKGATVIIHAADGSKTITTIPHTDPTSPSNTTGEDSATLSNPFQPKPDQTTSNTTSFTGGTTSGSNLGSGSVTGIGDDGKAYETNIDEVNALQGSGTDTTVEFGNADGTFASADGAASSLSQKMANFQPFNTNTLPKETSFEHTFSFENIGDIPVKIRLDSFPFPQLRVFLTLIMTFHLATSLIKHFII